MYTIRQLVEKYGKFVIWAVVIAFVIGGVVLFTPGMFNNTSANQNSEVIAATVNGDKVTETKLAQEFEKVLAQNRQLYQQFGQDFDSQLVGADGAFLKLGFKSEALKTLIEDILIEQERRKRRIDVSNSDVENKFKQEYQNVLDFVKQRYGWDEKELARFLKEQRQQDIRAFKNEIREQAREQLRKEKVKEEIVPKIEPSDAEVIQFIEDNRSRYESDIIGEIKLSDDELKAYYEKHKDKYTKTQYKTSHILIKTESNATAEQIEAARKKAEDVRNQALQANADFAALAKQHSDDPGSKEKGGDLGYVDKDTPFVQEFKDALFKLEVGQISEPTKSQFGFHIIKALEKRESAFEDIKDDVESDLKTEREEEAFKNWIESAKQNKIAEKYHLKQILVKIPENATAEQLAAAEKKAKDAKVELDKENANFDDVAKKFNEDEATKEEDGDLGSRELGSLPKEIQEAVKTLKSGDKKTDTSNVIKLTNAFVVVKLEEHKTWEDLKKEVKDDVISDKKSKGFDTWIEETKKKSTIELKDELLQAYALDKEGKAEEALALYEKLAKENTTNDVYLSYYVAKIYQSKLGQAKRKKDTLSNENLEWKRASDVIDLSQLLARLEEIATQPGKIEASLGTAVKDIVAKNKAATGKEEDRKKELVSQIQEAFKDKPEELTKLVTAIRVAELAPLEALIEGYSKKSLEFLTRTVTSGAAGDEKLFNSILDLNDKDPDVRYRYGLWLYGEGKVPEALAQIKQALELKPDMVDGLVLYGDLLRGNRNFGGAIEYYTKALPLLKDKKLVEIQEKLGDAYFGLQQWDKAKELYTKLYDEAAKDKNEIRRKIKFAATLGDVAYETADYATAEKFYKEAFDNEITNYVYNTKLAKARIQTGKVDDAVKALQRITKESKYIGDAWLALGDAYKLKNQTEEAVKAYREGFNLTADKNLLNKLGEKILELKPDDIDSRLRLADIYKSQFIYETAIKHYEDVLKQNSSADQKFTAYLGLGDSFASRGSEHYVQGKDYYLSAVQAAGDDTKKIQAYEKISGVEPNIVGVGKPYSADGKEALFQLGLLYKKTSQNTKSKENLEKLAQMDVTYKKADVEKMLAEIEGKKKEPTNALGPDNKPGQPAVEQPASHIDQDAKHDEYNTVPPTSGPHLGNAAPWAGIFKEPVKDELQVHNLEHGGVFLQYKADLAAETLKLAEEYVTTLRKDAKYCKVMLAPYNGLTTDFALTAWKRIDKFNGWDADRVKAFADAWLEQGPEKGIPCP
jgi:parvulin-like peptidyl-prolyl isomerase/Tfp pilus assembly protein PilF